MADYASRYQQIRAAGADAAAVSVDPPEKSEAVRKQLHLPFTILSDQNKQVIQDWCIYNPRERGGIARPAVFILDRDRNVLFASVDSTNSPVPTADIVRILQTHEPSPAARPKGYFPRPTDFVRAIRNGIRLRNR